MSRVRVAMAGAAIVAALLAAWSQWQPQRSEDARNQALALLASSDPSGASAEAATAVARDPLSLRALTTLGAVQNATGHTPLARATFEKGVRIQPSNPEAWFALGRYILSSDPPAALHALQAAIYLNPEWIAPERIDPPRANPEAVEIYNDYIQALRATQQEKAAKQALKSASELRSARRSAARLAARRRSSSRSARSRTAKPAH